MLMSNSVTAVKPPKCFVKPFISSMVHTRSFKSSKHRRSQLGQICETPGQEEGDDEQYPHKNEGLILFQDSEKFGKKCKNESSKDSAIKSSPATDDHVHDDINRLKHTEAVRS